MFEKVCVRLRLIPFKISIASSCHGSESYHSRWFLSERTATQGDVMKDRGACNPLLASEQEHEGRIA